MEQQEYAKAFRLLEHLSPGLLRSQAKHIPIDSQRSLTVSSKKPHTPDEAKPKLHTQTLMKAISA